MIVYYFYHHFMDNGIKVKHTNETWSGNLQDMAEDVMKTPTKINDLYERERYK